VRICASPHRERTSWFIEHAYGWPFLALGFSLDMNLDDSDEFYVVSGGLRVVQPEDWVEPPIVLPTRMILAGFVGNSGVLAAILFLG
jgi:hypothetical protein